MRGYRGALRERPDVEAFVRGPISTRDLADAQAGVAAVAAGSDLPVHHARVKIAGYTADDGEAFAVAQANLEVAGRLVRDQEVDRSVAAAVERVMLGLQQRVRRLEYHLADTPSGPPRFSTDEWGTGPAATGPTRLTLAHPQLLRHKAAPLAVQTVDAAAFTMDLRDYDVHLFVDERSGQEAIVHRAGPTGYRFACLRPGTGRRYGTVPLTVDPQPAPRLTLPQAITRLQSGDRPFVFFAGAAAGRGRVLYRRFDGHHGLITAAW